MTALYNNIKQQQLKFRQTGASLAAKALTYLQGEITRQKSQDLSDTAVIKVIKTTVNRLAQANDTARSEAGLRELQILRGFLPKEISGVELETLIRDLDFSTVPEAMRKLKMLNAPIDMGKANQIVRRMLA